MQSMYHHRGFKTYLGLIGFQAAIFALLLIAGFTVDARTPNEPLSEWLLHAAVLWTAVTLLVLFALRTTTILREAVVGLDIEVVTGIEAKLGRTLLRPLLYLAPVALVATDTLWRFGVTKLLAMIPVLLFGAAGSLISLLLLGLVARTFRDARRELRAISGTVEELKGKHSEAELKRLSDSLDYARGITNRNPFQKQRGLMLADMPSRPWYDRSNFPWAQEFEEKFSEIRNEALRVCSNLPGYTFAGYVTGQWTTYWLSAMNYMMKEAETECPVTTRLLKKVPGFPVTRESFFSILDPRSRILPHSDDSNVWITAHFGIQVPENCGIRVGRETRRWTEGQFIFFDTSFEHEAWNDSDTRRIVLLFDFLHPAVSDVERSVLLKFPRFHLVPPDWEAA